MRELQYISEFVKKNGTPMEINSQYKSWTVKLEIRINLESSLISNDEFREFFDVSITIQEQKEGERERVKFKIKIGE